MWYDALTLFCFCCFSYDMTPVRKVYKQASPDNYDISDIRSDDSTDDDDAPRKKIPAWASGNCLHTRAPKPVFEATSCSITVACKLFYFIQCSTFVLGHLPARGIYLIIYNIQMLLAPLSINKTQTVPKICQYRIHHCCWAVGKLLLESLCVTVLVLLARLPAEDPAHQPAVPAPRSWRYVPADRGPRSQQDVHQAKGSLQQAHQLGSVALPCVQGFGQTRDLWGGELNGGSALACVCVIFCMLVCLWTRWSFWCKDLGSSIGLIIKQKTGGTFGRETCA